MQIFIKFINNTSYELTCYRLAKNDKEKLSNIIKSCDSNGVSNYTNSSHSSVDYNVNFL